MELYYLCRNPSGDFYVTKDDEELTMEEVVTELQDKTQRIEALEAAALKVVETSGQVDHSGIYAYEMDYRRAIQRLAALLPGRNE